MTVAQSEKMFRDSAFADPGRRAAAGGARHVRSCVPELHARQADDPQAARRLGGQALGSDKDPRAHWKEFHDEFLSYGGPPIPMVRREMVGEGGSLFYRLAKIACGDFRGVEARSEVMRRRGCAPADRLARAAELRDDARSKGVSMIRVFLAYALSGFVALGYQVVWFRLFPDWFGSTSLSFALVTCNFIGGLGVGSLASRRVTHWIARVTGIVDALRLYGLVELLVAVAAALTVLAAGGRSRWTPRGSRTPAATWASTPGRSATSRLMW